MHYTITGHFTITKTTNGMLVEQIHGNNIVLNQGLAEIAKQHIGNGTSLEIATLEIGDGDTTPTPMDTELENAITTGVIRANQSQSDTTATLSFFITDAELPNGEYKELGLRTAGDILYTRALIIPTYTKSANEDTRIDYTITYNAVV